MELYLGEGSRDYPHYLPLIKRAASAWNKVLGYDVIEVKEDLVSYPLHPTQHYRTGSFYSEGVSVIYFTNLYGIAGYARSRTRWNLETLVYEKYDTDIFIQSSPRPAPGNLFNLYETLIHELGHGLGLAHITISGNIMSYAARISLLRPLIPFFPLGLFPDYVDYGQNASAGDLLYMTGDIDYHSLVMGLISPGAQDKLILSCLYSPSILSNMRQNQ